MKKDNARYRADLDVLRSNAGKNPDSLKAQLKLGTALIKLGLLSEGEKSLVRAVEIDPDCIEAWINLGGARLTRWDFEGCIQANQMAIKINPRLTTAHFNLGLGYLYQGNPEKMLECFEQVLQLDEQNAAAHYYMAVGLNALNRNSEAYQQLSIAVGMGHSPDPAFIKEMEKKFSNSGDLVQVMEFGPENSASNGNDSSNGRKEQK